MKRVILLSAILVSAMSSGYAKTAISLPIICASETTQIYLYTEQSNVNFVFTVAKGGIAYKMPMNNPEYGPFSCKQLAMRDTPAVGFKVLHDDSVYDMGLFSQRQIIPASSVYITLVTMPRGNLSPTQVCQQDAAGGTAFGYSEEFDENHCISIVGDK